MNTTRKRTIVTSLICLATVAAISITARELKAGTTETTKSPNAATNQTLEPLSQNPIVGGPQWDQQFKTMERQMDRMQSQMDKMFNQMSAQFPVEPRYGFPENSGYSLSFNVQDLTNRYVVHAFLPDTKVSDVNVKLKNNQTLQVSVSNQQSQTSKKKNETTSVSEWGEYEQLIHLPSPVKADDMKVVRHEHELLITLPKT